VLNVANEIAVEAFLARLRFGASPRLVLWTLEQLPVEPVSKFDALLEADADARRGRTRVAHARRKPLNIWRGGLTGPASTSPQAAASARRVSRARSAVIAR
jgi:hypothetical protein